MRVSHGAFSITIDPARDRISRLRLASFLSLCKEANGGREFRFRSGSIGIEDAPCDTRIIGPLYYAEFMSIIRIYCLYQKK